MIEQVEFNYGVIPINMNKPSDGIGHTDTQDFDYNYGYGGDYGGDYQSWYGDDSDYFGDFGNYDNFNDEFDGYGGVDSGFVTEDTAPHPSYQTAPSGPFLVYSQSSGNMMKVDAQGNTTMIATGYSGNNTYHNIPEAQAYKNEGPIPQGECNLTDVNNHKGPNTITLSPDAANNMFGRDNFLIHGDNSSVNFTASQGCIILNPTARAAIINSGITTLYVVH